jgi:hypothetical protein
MEIETQSFQMQINRSQTIVLSAITMLKSKKKSHFNSNTRGHRGGVGPPWGEGDVRPGMRDELAHDLQPPPGQRPKGKQGQG